MLRRVVSTWLGDPRVRKISFTGSTNVGRVLLRQAADRVVNSSMELGGNAPLIVTEDADLDAAVAGAMTAKFRNGGQACTAANRFYVHSDVADAFTARLGAAVEALAVGPAADPGNHIGPMISPRAVAKTEQLVAEAVAAGARVAHRATVPDGLTGHFYAPVVLTDVGADAGIVQEEVFGPVAPSSVRSRLAQVERLLADAIAREHQALLARVPERERERAAQVMHHVLVPVLVGAGENFRRGIGPERVAAHGELGLELGVVGDGAIERDRQPGNLVVKRLAEHHAMPAVGAEGAQVFAAGAAMRERLHHRDERAFLGRVAPCNPSGDRAHGLGRF